MGSSQSTFVFFSSFSVVLIAVDRLLFIVYPGSVQISTNMVSVITDKSSIDYDFSGCHSFHHCFSGLCSFCISTFLLHKIRSCVLRCCLLLWGVLVIVYREGFILQSYTISVLDTTALPPSICDIWPVDPVPDPFHHRHHGLHHRGQGLPYLHWEDEDCQP